MPYDVRLGVLRHCRLIVDILRRHGEQALVADGEARASFVFLTGAIADELAALDEILAPPLPDGLPPVVQLDAERLLAGIDAYAYALDRRVDASGFELAALDACSGATAAELKAALDGLLASRDRPLRADVLGILAAPLSTLVGTNVSALAGLNLALAIWLNWLVAVAREQPAVAGGIPGAAEFVRRIATWLAELDALLAMVVTTPGAFLEVGSSSSARTSSSSGGSSSGSSSASSSSGGSSSSSSSSRCGNPGTYEKLKTALGGLFVGNFDIKYVEGSCRIIIRIRVLYRFENGIPAADQARTITLLNRAVNYWNLAAELRCTPGPSCECCCHNVPIEVRMYRVSAGEHKVIDVTKDRRRPKVLYDVNLYVPYPPAPMPPTGATLDPGARAWNQYRGDEITFTHELGHVLGLYDEYDTSFPEWPFSNIWHDTDPAVVNDTEALMNSQYAGSHRLPNGVIVYSGTQFRERYFQHIAKWVNSVQPANRCPMHVHLLKSGI